MSLPQRSHLRPRRTGTRPHLADIVGISTGKAAAWAKLAARDWSDYVANRTVRR